MGSLLVAWAIEDSENRGAPSAGSSPSSGASAVSSISPVTVGPTTPSSDSKSVQVFRLETQTLNRGDDFCESWGIESDLLFRRG